MLCKTKYIILIHRHLFIFLHNPCFSVYILSTVLEVRTFPCGRTPLQLPKTLTRSSHNVGLTSDTSQNQRDGNWRMRDQDCTEGEGELPTPRSQFFPSNEQCDAKLHRAAG